MFRYITDRLLQLSSEPLGLIFALLLGVASAVTSACCTLPALGLIVGYSGSGISGNRKEAAISALFFTLGAIVSLMILGAISGFVGQVARGVLGRTWKIFAGGVAIFLGLAALKLLPFNLSLGKIGPKANRRGRLGPVLAGLVLGGIVAASSLPCNPGSYSVSGAASLQGAVFRATLLLGMFAVGFALPLGAIILGVSLGRMRLAAKGADAIIRWLAGIVLILVGFYFLLTF